MLLAALLVACGGGAGGRDVASVRHLPQQGGAPEVARVTDLGALAAIPARGPLPVDGSDGVFAIGELVLVEGDDFGKQPAVRIGGRPTEVLARTGNGGIVCRLPIGVAAGEVPVEVSHARGRDQILIEMRRYAVVTRPGRTHAVALGAAGDAAERGSFALPGAVAAAFSGDGRAAYVALDPGRGAERAGLAVLSMVSPGGPSVRGTVPLAAERVVDVASAPGARVAAALVDSAAIVLDTRYPLEPRIAAEIVLPAPATAAALSADGRTLAVLSSQSNLLTLVDLGDPDRPQVTGSASLLPAEKVALVRDLAFAPGDDVLWVLAGDDAASIAAGSRPTTLLEVALDGGITPGRAVAIDGAGAPRALAVSRREAVGAAAAIRSTRRRAAIAVTSVDRALLRPDSTFAIPGAAELGRIVSTDLDGRARVLAAGRELHDGAAIHDVRWVLSATEKVEQEGGRAVVRYGLTVAPLGDGKAAFTPLGDAAAASPLQAAPGAVAIAP